MRAASCRKAVIYRWSASRAGDECVSCGRLGFDWDADSMGLTPFACIPLPECVRIVYPDGYVESLARSCSVSEILFGNPDYYVCPDAPDNVANRLASDEQLENGVTYFICAAPNAQPFTEQQVRPKPSYRASRILPRFSRRHWIQGRELRSPTHVGNAGSRTKVFDIQSATMQQIESMRDDDAGDRPSLRLVFIRHCLQSLRLPRTSLEQFISGSVEVGPAPSTENDLPPILKSGARYELGLYVSRRQEFYLRRARRRRKVTWKPVLQSISEMSPVVEFHHPVAQQEGDSCGSSKRLSPPRPHSSVRRKNISPPRQQVFASAAKNISTPPPPPPLQVAKSSNPPQQRNRSSNGTNPRSLYMA